MSGLECGFVFSISGSLYTREITQPRRLQERASLRELVGLELSQAGVELVAVAMLLTGSFRGLDAVCVECNRISFPC